MMIKKTAIKYSLIIVFISSLSNSSGAETRVGIENFKIDSNTNLELRSKSMTFDNQNRTAHFFDDVKVEYGKLKLSAQKLIFIQSQSESDFNHLTFSASGPIIISDGTNFIYGNEAHFIEKKQELTIIGNIKLNQNNNIIMGEKLVLDLKKGIAKITGSVKTILNSTGKSK